MAVIGFTNLGNTAENSAYYEAEVAEAAQLASRTKLATYYATPTPARWICVGSEMAEDGSEIKPGEITAAFAGHAPNSSWKVDRNGQRYQSTEIASNVNDPDRRAATDVTVSQPKSVSALIRCAELDGQADLANSLRQAQSEVINDLVRHAAQIGLVRTRRGHGGSESEVPKDFMVAAVPHSKSRAGDPQEHFHLLFFNGCVREDGTTGTLDLSELVSHKFYLQGLYASGMAKKLSSLGFAVVPKGQNPRGQWELAGSPEKLIQAWSKRRAEVLAGLTGTAGDLARRQAAEQTAAEAGVQTEEAAADVATLSRSSTQAKREAKQGAALRSRRQKDTLPSEAELEAAHRQDVRDALRKDANDSTDYGPGDVIQAMRSAALLTPIPEGNALDAAVDYLFTRTSVATLPQFRTAVAEAAAIRGLSITEVDAEVQRGIDSGLVKAIGTTERGDTVVSTDAAIRMEWTMLAAARAAKGRGRLTDEIAERAIAAIEARERAAGKEGFTLAAEQRAFVKWFARGDGIAIGEGLAGTGKTTAMQAVVEAARMTGLHTIATAPTNSAAETLYKEAHTDEQLSIQALAMQIETGKRTISANDYILIDEAGMAELGHVATVIRAANQVGAQVGLVGDERQFAPIGAGAPFSALGAVLGTSRLDEIRRQQVPWQNQASRKMAAGDTDSGLMAYAAEGRWKFGENRAAAIGHVLADWKEDLERHGTNQKPATRLIIARQHEDAHALNAAARQILIDKGRLGEDEVVVRTLHRDGNNGDVRDLALRRGDELVVWRKVPNHELNNGDRITVERVEPIPGDKTGDVMLTWRTEKNGQVTTARLSSLTPPPAPDDPASMPRVPYLQHAYAVTQYSSQGKTVDKAYVYGGTGLDARSVYVSLTRHRDDATIYWDREGIAQQIREEGESSTRANIVEHIRRAARRMDDKLNVLDFARDAEAWLRTGDLNAEDPRPPATAARVAAAEANAAATVEAALADPALAPAVIAAAQAPQPPVPQPKPRTAPEVRASAAYERAVRKAARTAIARDRRHLARIDPIIRDLQRGAGHRLAAGLRAAPRRIRDDLREAAARAIPAIGEVLERWSRTWTARQRAAHLDARRDEITAAGEGRRVGLTAVADRHREMPQRPDEALWTDLWMRQNHMGGYAARVSTLDPAPTGRADLIARLPRSLERMATGLSDNALAALARPRLGASPTSAPTIAAGAYAAALEAERETQEARIVASVMRQTGKPESLVLAQLGAAVTQPETIQGPELQEGVRRLAALTQARDAVTAALHSGVVRQQAPIAALDPHSAPTAWRVELRRAQRATADHSPPPNLAADRAVFDGRRSIAVAEMVRLLQARRTALGVPNDLIAPPTSAAAQIDNAISILREAVVEGRLSGRSPIAAVAPSDRQAWAVAYRNAAFDYARGAGASRAEARASGLAADAIRSRVVSETHQRLAAQHVHRGEAPAVAAAIDAVRAAEPAKPPPSTQTSRFPTPGLRM